MTMTASLEGWRNSIPHITFAAYTRPIRLLCHSFPIDVLPACNTSNQISNSDLSPQTALRRFLQHR
jgi:hypothetical protein